MILGMGRDITFPFPPAFKREGGFNEKEKHILCTYFGCCWYFISPADMEQLYK